MTGTLRTPGDAEARPSGGTSFRSSNNVLLLTQSTSARVNCRSARRQQAFCTQAKKTKPHRVVRRRTPNWKMPPNTVYVERIGVAVGEI